MAGERSVLCCLAALALAGCTSDNAAESAGAVAGPAETAAASVGGPVMSAADLMNFKNSQRRHEVLWLNGSFTPQEHWFPVGMVVSQVTGTPGAAHVTDVSDKIQLGVPVRITLDLTTEALATGDINAFVNAPFDEYYTFLFTTPEPNHSHLEVGLVHWDSSAPIRVGVFYGALEPKATVPYTLRAELQAYPAMVIPGIPAAASLVPGSTLEVQWMEDQPDDAFLLWDPHDALVGRFPLQGDNLTIPLPGDAPAGEYVMLFSQAGLGGHIRMLSAASQPTLRALKQDIISGDEKDAPANGPLDWAFEVPRVPIQVGLGLVQSVLIKDHKGSIRSPAGELIAFDHAGGLGTFAGNFWFTNMGAEGLVPGTYEVHWESSPSVEAKLQHFIVYYQR